jgi:hypothetical protein
MKKFTIRAMCLLAGIVLGLAVAQAVTRTYEYLEKSVATEYGYPATAWRCVRLEVELGMEHPTGVLTFRGWKDMDAFFAGKPAMASERVVIENAETLTNYAPLFQELLTKVISTPGGTFEGAVYKTVEHDPNPAPQAPKAPAK